MQIQRPRAALKVLHGNKMVYKVGPRQMTALLLLEALGPKEVPPRGVITATGHVREHTIRDMLPLQFVKMEYNGAIGSNNYTLTKIGQEVLRNGITTDGKSAKILRPKVKSLLAKQRERQAARDAARAAKEAKAKAKHSGRRNGRARAAG